MDKKTQRYTVWLIKPLFITTETTKSSVKHQKHINRNTTKQAAAAIRCI